MRNGWDDALRVLLGVHGETVSEWVIYTVAGLGLMSWLGLSRRQEFAQSRVYFL
jgi:hypothetical protein